MTKHFVFVVGPGAGHVNPTLPLVEELTARGNRVTYITGEPFRSAVTASGAATLDVRWEAPVPEVGQGVAEVIRSTICSMQRQAQESFATTVAHFQQDPPDAVCYDSLAPLGTLLADKLSVPSVMLSPTMASNEHFNVALSGNSIEEEEEEVDRILAEVVESDNQFRSTNGLPDSSDPLPVFGSTARMKLVFVPREFQIAGDKFDDSHIFLGPSVGVRETSNEWTPPSDGSQVLFVSLGTGFNDRPDFFAQCVEAFADSRWHVVMAVGGRVQLEKVPTNFEVAPYFPQLKVLQHAAVFLSHTGMNSTMESLYYAVPLVSVAQTSEQATNGNRVHELGLGCHLENIAITARSLREVVDTVAADTQIRANIDTFSKQMRTTNGAARGADALERLLNQA